MRGPGRNGNRRLGQGRVAGVESAVPMADPKPALPGLIGGQLPRGCGPAPSPRCRAVLAEVAALVAFTGR